MGDGLTGLRWSAEDLRKDIDWLTERNKDDELRCRELSLAITHLETGVLWLEAGIASLSDKE